MTSLSATLSAARKPFVDRFVDAWSAFVEAERSSGAEAGERLPLKEALAFVLSTCLALSRVALSHAKQVDLFDEVVRKALALEAEGWDTHRKTCARCGGH